MMTVKGTVSPHQQLINTLRTNNIETRPIVSGNFAKNEVLKYFNYEIHGDLKNANYIDKYGFFVGNQQVCIKEQIKFLKDVLDNKLK
jgi:CDP-6-deoxy-D-xylo-4-hexulose-3-dehydrase